MIRKVVLALLAAATILALSVISVGSSAALAADSESVTRVMGSIDIQANEHAGDLSTVNGSIHVGSGAVVGQVKTVNGSVKLDPHATANVLTTTNGSVNVGDGARVNGDVHTVNGALRVGHEADIAGEVSNINGGIHISSAHVHGSIKTTSGNVVLGPDAHIDGGFLMEAGKSWHFGIESIPHIVILPGSVVKGTLRFKRDVKLYVSDRATIGAVEGASPIKFSGDHPPSDSEDDDQD